MQKDWATETPFHRKRARLCVLGDKDEKFKVILAVKAVGGCIRGVGSEYVHIG